MLKTRKSRKRVEDKKRNKEQGNKGKTAINLVAINPTMSVRTLNISG